MPDILKPEKNSKENILLFIETIEDEELRNLLKNNIEKILAIGADQDPDRTNRNSFFEAIGNLINTKTGGDDEN